MSIRNYLESKGIKIIKVENGQLVPDRCFFDCEGKEQTRNSRSLFINENNGKFFCHSCGAKGGDIALRKHFGDNIGKLYQTHTPKKLETNITIDYDEMDAEALENQNVLFVELNRIKHHVRRYLNFRGLTDETITEYRLGAEQLYFKDEKKNVEGTYWFVSIPVITEENKVVLIKRRSAYPDKKMFLRRKNGKTTLFGKHLISTHDYSKIYITEGEIDAMTLHQYGFKNVVSLTAGVQQAAKNEEIRDFLSPYRDIYIVFDSDKVGQDNAKLFAKSLGEYRCKIIKLPYKDPNECLQKGVEKEDIDEIIDRTKPSMVSLKDLHKQYIEEFIRRQDGGILGDSTGFKALNALTEGWKQFEVWLLVGDSGKGKSTFATYLLYLYAQTYNDRKTLVFSLEMGNLAIYRKVFNMMTPKLIKDYSLEEIKKEQQKLNELPIIFWNKSKPTPDEMFLIIKYAINVYQVKLVLIDHVYYVVNENDNGATADFVSKLSDLAQETQIDILLLGHTKKRDKKSKSDNDDIKGSGSLVQLVDNVLFIDRKLEPEENEVNKVDVSVKKCRLGGGTGMLKFQFVPITSSYKELSTVEILEDGSLIINKPESFEEEIKAENKKKEWGETKKKLAKKKDNITRSTLDITETENKFLNEEETWGY